MKQNIAKISNVYGHYVGNKSTDDRVVLSKASASDSLTEEEKNHLKEHFLEPFSSNEDYHSFIHEVDVQLNEVYSIIADCFDQNHNDILQQSQNLARILLKRSLLPGIKTGDFYIVMLEDLIIEGELVKGIGLFKSEEKNIFVKNSINGTNMQLGLEEGVEKSKIDKGCLVYNTDKESGYRVLTIDKTNKGKGASFWKDTFLQISRSNNSFSMTDDFLSLTKNFITNKEAFGSLLNKVDQVEILNKSINFFKENEQFDKATFVNDVFKEPEVIDAYQKFESQFQDDNDRHIPDTFSISSQAVSKKSRAFKRVLKLDKNFHIYIHGNRELIEKGIDDDTGKNFYKIYFNEES